MTINKVCSLLSAVFVLLNVPARFCYAQERAIVQSVEQRIERIRQLDLPSVQFTAIDFVSDGSSAGSRRPGAPDLPKYCRVAATLTPSLRSDIKIEIWLPEPDAWNRRMLGTGNGGAAGSIVYGSLANGLKRGFATANTDLGTSPRGEGPVGNLEKAIDWGNRATHEMTRVSKRVIEAYYGASPEYAYFLGNSTGGHQALMEVQRYPEDYDGVVAGAPGNNRTHLHAMFFHNWLTLQTTPSGAIPRDKIELLHKEIIAAHVGQDGGAPTDNFLTDPRIIDFELDALLAKAESSAKLTSDQIDVLKQFYAGPLNPTTGERIYTGLPLGSELNMPINSVPTEPRSTYIFRWALADEFDAFNFDLDKGLDRVNQILAKHLNAVDADLTTAQQRDLKIIMFAGTADCITPYQDAVHYYDRVIDRCGSLEEAQQFFRFFVVPGLSHVNGSDGPSVIGQNLDEHHPIDPEHDLLAALMAWVEQDVAPEQIIATSFNDARDPSKGVRAQRPLYPYPLFPHYTDGAPENPESYKPVAHPRGHVAGAADRYLTNDAN